MHDDTKKDALGAQLIANDKWLVTNILKAEHWAQGTAEELLDGSAWRRFTERLGQLAERIQAAHTPATPIDRADGYRYLSMLVRNAFDVAIEDIDPDRPRFNWLTRRNKMGWDCPDALYAYVAIRDDATYRISGRRGNVHFLGLQVMSGIRSLHNGHADEWHLAPDGSFEIVVSPTRHDGNWIPLESGADTIWMRQFFYDWEREEPASLWIDRIDDGPRVQPHGMLDPGFFARRLDAVATNVEANVDLWLFTAIAMRERYCNVFPAEAIRRDADGRAEASERRSVLLQAGGRRSAAHRGHAAAGKVLEHRRLQLLARVARLREPSVELERPSSGASMRTVYSARWSRTRIPAWRTGSIRCGHREGSLIYRWNLADSTPVPAPRVVKFDALRDDLPRDTRRVSPEERARQIDVRREHVRRRFARPL